MIYIVCLDSPLYGKERIIYDSLCVLLTAKGMGLCNVEDIESGVAVIYIGGYVAAMRSMENIESETAVISVLRRAMGQVAPWLSRRDAGLSLF